MNQLPFYVLCEHSAIHSGPPSNALAHPTIQYHYANDSPLALWPQHPNEHVLVLDYDPTTTKTTLKSMSNDLAVVSLKVEEAPGAGAADADGTRSDRMYIIQTTATDGSVVDPPYADRKSAHNVLAQYKRRNATLRRVLLYPDTPEELSPHPDS